MERWIDFVAAGASKATRACSSSYDGPRPASQINKAQLLGLGPKDAHWASLSQDPLLLPKQCVNLGHCSGRIGRPTAEEGLKEGRRKHEVYDNVHEKECVLQMLQDG